MASRPRMNPFEAVSADVNFPPLSSVFEQSPSIDTIARTKPVDFSIHSDRSFASGGCHPPSPSSVHESPMMDAENRSVQGLRSRSPRHRPRVVKQLNFSLTSAPRERGVSRADAAAAGWPTPTGKIHSAPGALRSALASKGGARSGASSTRRSLTAALADPAAQMPADSAGEGSGDHPHAKSAVGADRQSGSTVPSSAQTVQTGMPRSRSYATGELASIAGLLSLSEGERPAASALPRSPSAPVFSSASGTRTAAEARDRMAPAAGAPAESSALDEARRALLQPPSFAFTAYLRSLLERWPETPITRTRLTELGLSPGKLGAARLSPPPPGEWSPPSEPAPTVSAAAAATAAVAAAAAAAATVAAVASQQSAHGTPHSSPHRAYAAWHAPAGHAPPYHSCWAPPAYSYWHAPPPPPGWALLPWPPPPPLPGPYAAGPSHHPPSAYAAIPNAAPPYHPSRPPATAGRPAASAAFFGPPPPPTAPWSPPPWPGARPRPRTVNVN